MLLSQPWRVRFPRPLTSPLHQRFGQSVVERAPEHNKTASFFHTRCISCNKLGGGGFFFRLFAHDHPPGVHTALGQWRGVKVLFSSRFTENIFQRFTWEHFHLYPHRLSCAYCRVLHSNIILFFRLWSQFVFAQLQLIISTQQWCNDTRLLQMTIIWLTSKQNINRK